MSGIEVVGIVLGALPLAISLFQSYEELAASKNRLVSFEELYKKVYKDLQHEQLLFRSIIETLIRPLVNDEMIHKDDLDRIVNSTGDVTWVNPDVEQALRERLGEFHMPFVEVVEDTQQQCMQLLKILGFDKPILQVRIFGSQRAGVSSPSANNTLMDKARQTYNRFDFELERVSFASNKTKQEHLIDCIQNNNRKLEKFLEYSGKVAALREDSAPKVRHSVAKHLLRYWTHANRLYDLLGRAWGCQCRDYHYARLYLQHRTSPSFELCLLVLYALTPSPAHAWREQSLKIEQVRNRDLADPGSISVPSLPSTAPSGVHAATPAKSSVLSRMKKKFRDHKKQVAIQEAAPAPSAAPASLSSTISSLPGGPSIGVDIQHMCNIMSTCGVKAKCLGALRDDIADQTYSVSLQPAPQKSSDSITLHELLHDTSRPKMYRSQSYAIALAVCSSYLQLQSTAWANKVWTVKDINFPVVGGVPLLDQPYIATRFDDTQAATIQPPAALADRVFVCLGVMLLELCCRQLIEDSSWWQRLGADDAQKSQLWFRVSVAGEWLKEVEYEEGPEMASAIRWCLHESPRVFEGERWRKDLADRVVLPVQDCCRFLGGNILKT